MQNRNIQKRAMRDEEESLLFIQNPNGALAEMEDQEPVI
jgi:hypothetical protein